MESPVVPHLRTYPPPGPSIDVQSFWLLLGASRSVWECLESIFYGNGQRLVRQFQTFMNQCTFKLLGVGSLGNHPEAP